MRRILSTLLWAALLLAPAPACAGPTWAKVDGVTPTGISRAADFERFDTHMLLYSTSSSGVAISSSVNGTSWVALATVDDEAPLGIDVLKTETGAFIMVYPMVNPDYLVHSRSSSDGVTWSDASTMTVTVGEKRQLIRDVAAVKASVGEVYYFLYKDPDSTDERYTLASAQGVDEGSTDITATELLTNVPYIAMAAESITGTYESRLYFLATGDNDLAGDSIVAYRTDGAGKIKRDEGTLLTVEQLTDPERIATFAVGRDTDSWRRAMLVESIEGTAVLARESAPSVDAFSPNTADNDDTASTLQFTGEAFHPAVSAQLEQFPEVATLQITYGTDGSFRGFFNPFGRPAGKYDLRVTNPDGGQFFLPTVFDIAVQAGFVVTTDNLLEPAKGMRARFDVTAFLGDRLSLNVYDRAGSHVATLHDAFTPAGLSTYYWDGKRSDGTTVSSGLYFVKTNGPRLSWTSKVVVIR